MKQLIDLALQKADGWDSEEFYGVILGMTGGMIRCQIIEHIAHNMEQFALSFVLRLMLCVPCFMLYDLALSLDDC